MSGSKENMLTRENKIQTATKKLGVILSLLASFCLAISLCGCSKKTATEISEEKQDAETELDNRVNPSIAPDSSFLYDTSIQDLIESPVLYDNQTVQVEGEVIGDRRNVTNDPAHYWITLQEQQKSANYPEIIIMISETTSSLIDSYGEYGKSGTCLVIKGTFHAACEEHEGLSDIHADSSSLKAKGADRDEYDLSVESFIPAIILLMAAVAVTLLYRHIRKKEGL